MDLFKIKTVKTFLFFEEEKNLKEYGERKELLEFLHALARETSPGFASC